MPYVVKAPLAPGAADGPMSFHEKSMWRGKEVREGDGIFVFVSDHHGGQGLVARGVVTAVARGPGTRVTIEVRPTARAKRPLGRAELKPFRELDDGRPQTEIARKLYRQATNKVAGISDAAAEFLAQYF